MAPQRTTLVTGGIRSGKSRFAEGMLWDRDTTYVATGRRRDDAAWAERLRHHQERRPSRWASVETTDVASALATLDGPCLLDDVGSWLTAALQRAGAWHLDDTPPDDGWPERYRRDADAFVESVAHVTHDLVIVTNEVGFGLVSPYDSGRVFQDELGRLNQRIAMVCDTVVLVVSGCPLAVKGSLATTASGDHAL